MSLRYRGLKEFFNLRFSKVKQLAEKVYIVDSKPSADHSKREDDPDGVLYPEIQVGRGDNCLATLKLVCDSDIKVEKKKRYNEG